MAQNIIQPLALETDLFDIFKEVLVLDIDPDESDGVLERFAKKAGLTQEVYVAAFFEERADELLCLNTGTCGAADKERMLRFARRVCGVSNTVLEEEALMRLLSDDERVWFRIENPLFVPLLLDGEVIGAAWCSCVAAAPVKEKLVMVCQTLCTAFRNRLYYKSVAGHESSFTRLLDNIGANICVTSLDDDRILFINKKMREDFNIRENITGKKCWQYLQPGSSGRCSFCPCNMLALDPSQTIVWEEHNTVTGKYYKNVDSVVEWLDGTLVHLRHSVDITAEKTIQQSLVDAKRIADLASKAKGDFLSRMSHEIRTPLNAIIGMTHIGMGTADFNKMQECIRKIDSSSNQLLGLINDILDMSKIEASKMELVNERFDFEKMLIDVSNVISIKSEEKRQKLHIHMNMNMPRFYKGDDLRVTQVITNLLSNAVKFTPEYGTVRMDVCEKSRDGNVSVIEVRVSDTGIGIPQDRQALLFTAFEQADGSIARRFGGTGLGLAISKSIVEMMDGEISVKSEPGQGSIFLFTIKLERVEDAKLPRKMFKDVDFGRVRAILCDESAEIREYFAQIMETFGVYTDTVSTVEECTRLLNEGEAAGTPYRLIFIDWNIPNMNGGELCKILEERYGACIIVLVSNTQWSEIKTQAESPSVSKFLAKPIFPSTLFNVINETVGMPDRQAEAVQGVRYLFAGYRIIIAEDVEVNREVLCMALEDTKVKVVHAENGKAAADLFEADPAAYDLILMDVNMPVMDGYDATKYIRSLNVPWAKKVPILAMTANAFSEDIEKSIASGMNDHLTKPVNFDLLFSKLQKYLIDYKLSTANQNTGVMKMSEPRVGLGTPDIPELSEYINVDDALARVRGNRKIYKTLLQSFVNNSRMNELTEEINGGDLDAAGKTAHSIKGASANLSLIVVSETAAALEAQVKAGTYDRETFERLLAGFEKTKELIALLMTQL